MVLYLNLLFYFKGKHYLDALMNASLIWNNDAETLSSFPCVIKPIEMPEAIVCFLNILPHTYSVFTPALTEVQLLDNYFWFLWYLMVYTLKYLMFSFKIIDI